MCYRFKMIILQNEAKALYLPKYLCDALTRLPARAAGRSFFFFFFQDINRMCALSESKIEFAQARAHTLVTAGDLLIMRMCSRALQAPAAACKLPALRM